MDEPPRASFLSRVEWSDTDASCHHHNSLVMRCVEAAEAELMRSRGVDGYFGAAPRVRHEIDFEARLFFGQQVTAIVWIAEIGNRSMTFRFEVWGEPHRGQERLRAASGRFVTVYAPDPTAGASPWPQEWLVALADPSSDSETRAHAGKAFDSSK